MAGLIGGEFKVTVNGFGARWTSVDIKLDGKSIDITPANPPTGVGQQKPDKAGTFLTVDVEDLADDTASDSYAEALADAAINKTAVEIECIKTTDPAAKPVLKAWFDKCKPFYIESGKFGGKKSAEFTSGLTLKGSGGGIPAAA